MILEIIERGAPGKTAEITPLDIEFHCCLDGMRDQVSAFAVIQVAVVAVGRPTTNYVPLRNFIHGKNKWVIGLFADQGRIVILEPPAGAIGNRGIQATGPFTV